MSTEPDSDRSIPAYDDAARVARYDADMDIMHPNRRRMVEVVGEVLPFGPDDAPRFADLGVGTGCLAESLLDRFPHARLVGVDGAPSMLRLAALRLAAHRERVELVQGDLRRPDALLPGDRSFDAVVTCFALHHLGADEKLSLLRVMRDRLAPGGWFLDADLIVYPEANVEARIQVLRVEGIMRRAPDRDLRFGDARTTRATLDQLEASEGDRPLPLARDLELLREAGFAQPVVLWQEYREAVRGARA